MSYVFSLHVQSQIFSSHCCHATAMVMPTRYTRRDNPFSNCVISRGFFDASGLSTSRCGAVAACSELASLHRWSRMAGSAEPPRNPLIGPGKVA